MLPTGRNFYSVDNRAVPTPTAWELGRRSAENLILRHLQDQGLYLKSLALSVWGTARTIPPLCLVVEVAAPGLLVIKHHRGDDVGKFVNVAVSLVPAVVVAPTVEKLAVGGFPAVPSLGGVVGLPLGFGEAPGVHVAATTSAPFASFVAR